MKEIDLFERWAKMVILSIFFVLMLLLSLVCGFALALTTIAYGALKMTILLCKEIIEDFRRNLQCENLKLL